MKLVASVSDFGDLLLKDLVGFHSGRQRGCSPEYDAPFIVATSAAADPGNEIEQPVLDFDFPSVDEIKRRAFGFDKRHLLDSEATHSRPSPYRTAETGQVCAAPHLAKMSHGRKFLLTSKSAANCAKSTKFNALVSASSISVCVALFG